MHLEFVVYNEIDVTMNSDFVVYNNRNVTSICIRILIIKIQCYFVPFEYILDSNMYCLSKSVPLP